MTAPKVSVVMSSYNHAQFVGQAAESVLKQTFPDFEFIIGDDGSTDDTPEVIRGISDPRIVFTAHPHNRGAAVVTNESLLRCRGEYIARINSDDFWPLDKLAYQVRFLDAHPEYGAMFGDAAFVDAAGTPLAERPHEFAPPNTTRGGWLRRFFEQGNCLCHPTLLIRRTCFDALGGYTTLLRQVPDFEMWVRLVKRYALYVSDRVLTTFRILPGENASTPSSENLIRHSAEHYLIAERFFADVDHDLLREGFGDLLAKPELPSEAHRDIEHALLFFRPGPLAYLRPIYRVVGLRKLESVLASAPHREILRAEYGIGPLDFQRIAASVDTFTAAFAGEAAMVDLEDLLPPPASHRRDRPLTPPGPIVDAEVTAPAPAPWQPLVQAAIAALDNDRLPEGQAACLALLGRVDLPDDVRDLVYAIQSELAQPLTDIVPSASRIPLHWPVATGIELHEPSPVIANERLLVFVRAVRSPGAAHEHLLLTLEDDFAVASAVSLTDETGLADRFGDVRPFVLDCRLHVSFIADDPGDEQTRVGIAAITGGAYQAPRLFGPRAGVFSQGWAPIAAAHGVRFLAWWEPIEVLRFDHERETFERDALRRVSHVAERFWSGSQGVAAAGGSLLLVNERTALDDVEETATCRFALLDDRFQLTALSAPFHSSDERGRSTATGLARRGDQLIAGFSCAETPAMLVSMDLSEVLSALVPIGAPGGKSSSA